MKIVDNLKLDDTLKELFIEQLKLILEHEKDHSIDKKRILTSEINDLREKMDLMEYRFAINEISKDIFERQNQKLKEGFTSGVADNAEEIQLPSDPMAQLYFAGLSGLSIYILYRLMKK